MFRERAMQLTAMLVLSSGCESSDASIGFPSGDVCDPALAGDDPSVQWTVVEPRDIRFAQSWVLRRGGGMAMVSGEAYDSHRAALQIWGDDGVEDTLELEFPEGAPWTSATAEGPDGDLLWSLTSVDDLYDLPAGTTGGARSVLWRQNVAGARSVFAEVDDYVWKVAMDGEGRVWVIGAEGVVNTESTGGAVATTPRGWFLRMYTEPGEPTWEAEIQDDPQRLELHVNPSGLAYLVFRSEFEDGYTAVTIATLGEDGFASPAWILDWPARGPDEIVMGDDAYYLLEKGVITRMKDGSSEIFIGGESASWRKFDVDEAGRAVSVDFHSSRGRAHGQIVDADGQVLQEFDPLIGFPGHAVWDVAWTDDGGITVFGPAGCDEEEDALYVRRLAPLLGG